MIADILSKKAHYNKANSIHPSVCVSLAYMFHPRAVSLVSLSIPY